MKSYAQSTPTITLPFEKVKVLIFEDNVSIIETGTVLSDP
jgi:hypothetical protein